jgi:hydrogenase maturation protein HypF
MGRLGRMSVRVEGVVQGVGFRPFVHATASRLGLSGHVGNDALGVFAEVEGDRAEIGAFLESLRRDAPPLAVIDRVTATEIAPVGAEGFVIVPSPRGGEVGTLISPDTATCAACLAELADAGDRRYRYPFVNCTHCGPRFTIVCGVPYDRPLTTMAPFEMCTACAAEYHDPADRRFHAQPVCCPACGPALRFVSDGRSVPGDPVPGAARWLRDGLIVAVKGVGGYHLAADACSDVATEVLRRRKHRADKPFAVMVPDLATARRLCEVDDLAERLLSGRRRPIVLLPRRAEGVAEAVAPGSRQLGLMLPYTPLHQVLLDSFAGPIVLTSGNVSDEPIAYRDGDAIARLSSIADAFLTHDRAIHVRTDDSVVRPFRGRVQVQRRSRGYVPEPVPVTIPFGRHVLACGAELKNTFCLGKDRRAFLSHHIGDLENFQTLRAFREGIEHFRRLFDIEPEVVAHDLHPEYLSTKYALELDGVELVGVQHHHAHIASCLADNGEPGPVLGVAFDGLGYGADRTLWGGEFLRADFTGFERLAHLSTVAMPGGAAAVRQPWRMAAAHLLAAGLDTLGRLEVRARHESRWPGVLSMARGGVNAPLTSSAGRLFDAVAALAGVRDEVNYEGQAAVELEQCADPAEAGCYPMGVSGTGPLVLSCSDLVRATVDDLCRGVPVPVIAARFHNGLADAITRTCVSLRDTTGLDVVALSGGVFQNLLLLDRTVTWLTEHGFRVLTHSRVPANDGGLSLGQAVIAGCG